MIDVMKKVCSKCGEEKSLNDFSKHVKRKDGVQNTCKKCTALKRHDRVRKNIAINNRPDWISPKNKYCNRCKQVKNGEFFNKNNTTLDGLSSACRDCYVSVNLKTRFNITLEDYNKILHKQQHVCAICSSYEKVTKNNKVVRLAVDHDHKTGKIRGLLCYKCNTSLGGFNDDSDILQSAIDYLTEHESCT